ncbi:MAG: PaaI family thioesterase [Actinomycetota bacterium]
MAELSLTPDIVNRTISQNWSEAPHRCVEVSPTHALARSVTADVSLRPGGFIPGPTQFSLADVALWYLAFGALDRVEPMALTSELSIRFLRPAQGEIMWARADLDKAGRSSIVGTVKIWMDDRPDRLVSTAQGTYALPRD